MNYLFIKENYLYALWKYTIASSVFSVQEIHEDGPQYA